MFLKRSLWSHDECVRAGTNSRTISLVSGHEDYAHKKPETFSQTVPETSFFSKIIGGALRSGLLVQLTVRWSQRRAAPSLKTVLDSPSSRHLWRISPLFFWFCCCFSPRHTAVTGHQYPACSWAADAAGARSYRSAAAFTDRYRSSARMLTRLSLYLLSQFIVLGVDGPSNCVWCYCGWMTRRYDERTCVSACYELQVWVQVISRDNAQLDI